MGKILRSPIITTLGHVDHGKTTLLDKVRGTAVQRHEVSGLTQHIGASHFPIETIYKIVGDIVKERGIEEEEFRKQLKVPGLLFIDTPGHEAFFNLRERGSSISDLAVLVIDVNAGPQPQTYESLRLLKKTKTPYVVAANKIDKLPSWKSEENVTFEKSYNEQIPTAKRNLRAALDDILIGLSEVGYNANLYTKVKNFKKTVAIVPTSAITGEGVPDLFFVLTALAQKYLEKELQLHPEKTVGSILEVKHTKAGTALDVILSDGKLSRGEIIVLGGKKGPISAKIRSLLSPRPLDEMRSPKEKFEHLEEVKAAAGVRVLASSSLEGALAGSTIYGIDPSKYDEEGLQRTLQEKKKEIAESISKILFRHEKEGIILKADTLGSIEAILETFENKNIPVALSGIGNVNKEDFTHAMVVREKNPKYAVLVAFNVGVTPEAKKLIEKENLKLIRDDVIYGLFDALEEYLREWERRKKEKILEIIGAIGKIEPIPKYVFRTSKPAIFGVRVIGGEIETQTDLIREGDGERVGTIKRIEKEGSSIERAESGEEVAISVKGGYFGRNIKEDDTLYTDLSEQKVRLIRRELKESLPPEKKDVLKEIVKAKRKAKGGLWGI